MSKHSRYYYSIQNALRRQKYLERITNNTRFFFQKYKESCKSVIQEGLDQYVSNEIEKASKDLDLVVKLLPTCPESARDICMQMNDYMPGLESLARKIRNDIKQREDKQHRNYESQKQSSLSSHKYKKRDEDAKRCEEENRRREQYLNRIRENTLQFSKEYAASYQALLNQGLDEYLPEEFAEVKEYLDTIAANLDDDPEKSRDLSFELKPLIKQLPRLAHEAKHEHDAHEREISHQQKAAHDRESYLAFIREKTGEYCDKYISLFNDLINQDLEEYLPEEFRKVRQALNDIQTYLKTNPEKARDISIQLKNRIYSLPKRARAARNEAENQARDLKKESVSPTHENFSKKINKETTAVNLKKTRVESKETQSDSMETEKNKPAGKSIKQIRLEFDGFLGGLLSGIEDPVVRDFAYDDIRSIQQSYSGRVLNAHEIESEKNRVNGQMNSILRNAREKTLKWKKEKAREVQSDAKKELVKIHREEIARDVEHNPEALKNVLSGLDRLHDRLEQGIEMNDDDFHKEIGELTSRADDAVVDELCRQQTVKAVYVSLRKAGFSVAKPKRNKDGDRDVVVIHARKPSGHKAKVHVTIDGSMEYKFDQYEGMTCKKDIDKILPMLQEIYGIQLSNERVLWENPERISRSSRPINPEIEEMKHGG